ncbi:hypothetical protein KAF25_002020 [Fusarium avenaceum]|uniref:Uncharacterized protein n=1 Tax=Fusarium avenaceum TaxID=40199 RepID=A0A9P7KUI2_9HYPO|nr:hypothetical protein KAF25_002020 [Fusarium avenaceum]
MRFKAELSCRNLPIRAKNSVRLRMEHELFEDLGLSIAGIGVQYPPHMLGPEALSTLSHKFYPGTPAMKKLLSINRFTGIDTRSSIGTANHPIVNQKHPPTVSELHQVFVDEGVPLAIAAARQSINEAGIHLDEITHIVSTTCTDNSNPGFDTLVVEGLGLQQQVEKVLLQGVGCSGGLAVLRTAANLALGRTARRRPARILCIALEVCTTLVRSELDSVHELQETRIGAALFSDCASAMVLCNDIGGSTNLVYELLGWDHRIIPDTADHLRFDADPLGWKVVLTPQVPAITCSSLPPIITDLLASIPSIPEHEKNALNLEWAVHPGGLTILTGIERVLGITPQHLRASYYTYIQNGNSSSATIYSVLDRLRTNAMDVEAPASGPADYVMACAFGPGIAVEVCTLKRNMKGN